MKKLKVVKVDSDSIEFDNGVELSSDHDQDCCEHHYLDFSDLTLEDFEGFEFNLTNEDFFNRVPDYGITLKPIHGHPIGVPGYGSNNGYYGSNIDLVISKGKDFRKTFDVSDCQVISE